jgi:hypothetical protein
MTDLSDADREAAILAASEESKAASATGNRPLARYWLREMEASE